jgi:hypothetical protein
VSVTYKTYIKLQRSDHNLTYEHLQRKQEDDDLTVSESDEEDELNFIAFSRQLVSMAVKNPEPE